MRSRHGSLGQARLYESRALLTGGTLQSGLLEWSNPQSGEGAVNGELDLFKQRLLPTTEKIGVQLHLHLQMCPPASQAVRPRKWGSFCVIYAKYPPTRGGSLVEGREWVRRSDKHARGHARLGFWCSPVDLDSGGEFISECGRFFFCELTFCGYWDIL